MESQSVHLSSSPLLHNPIPPPPSFLSFNSKPLSVFNGAHFSPITKTPLQNPHFLLPKSSPFRHLTKPHLHLFLTPLPSFALETDHSSDKISLESILLSIDGFFNRYPFFVAGCTFIWLVVIPLIQYSLRKYKFVSAIDAFRRIRDDPCAQLLDIRDGKSLGVLGSPNLRILNKDVAQVEYLEEEDGFVKKVMERFGDDSNAVVFVLDNFDGNSMKVAELLFKNGFKEAYAIKDGVRGEKGWLAIQESLLPPSVHMKKRKKTKASQKFGTNGGVFPQRGENEAVPSSKTSIGEIETSHLHVDGSSDTEPQLKTQSWSSSPYPNYPDLKPPSSPTPSKPEK